MKWILKFGWIVADNFLANVLNSVAPHSNYSAGFPRNRDTHARTHVRATPLACARVKLSTDLEI